MYIIRIEELEKSKCKVHFDDESILILYIMMPRKNNRSCMFF